MCSLIQIDEPNLLSKMRGFQSVFGVILIFAVYLAATACSQQDALQTDSSVDVSPAEAQPVVDLNGKLLPGPVELAPLLTPVRNSTYVPDDLFISGSGYNQALPAKNVQIEYSYLNMYPDWSPENPDAGDLAYCIYEFNVPDFDRNLEFQLQWYGSTPDDPTTVWIGLANWDGQRWDWYQCDNGYHVNPPGITQYFDSSMLLAAVLLCNTGFAELDHIYMGPTVSASISSATTGVAPHSASFSAATSSTLTGVIDLYEWDWDNDGIYEENTGDTAFADHTYATAGSHTATVRATNSGLGTQGKASMTVNVVAPWAHSWGTDTSEVIHAMACDGQSIYLTGTRFDESFDYDVLLLKYNLAGDIQWSREWGGAGTDLGFSVVVADNGGVYVAGYTSSYGAGGSDVLLQRWDSAGNLVWARTWGSVNFEEGKGLATRGDELYVVGTTDGFGDWTRNVLLLSFDTDGVIQWGRAVGGPEPDNGTDIVTTRSLGGTVDIHVVGDTQSYSVANSSMLYARYSTEGALHSIAVLRGSDHLYSRAIHAIPTFGFTLYFTGMFQDNIAVAKVDNNTLAWSKSWGGTGIEDPHDLLLHNSQILVCGKTYVGPTGTSGLLLNLSLDGSLQDAQTWDIAEDYDEFNCLGAYPGSGVILGGRFGSTTGGAWAPVTTAFANASLSWAVQSDTALAVSGTTGTPGGSAVDLTDSGVINTGGGYADAAVIVIPTL